MVMQMPDTTDTRLGFLEDEMLSGSSGYLRWGLGPLICNIAEKDGVVVVGIDLLGIRREDIELNITRDYIELMIERNQEIETGDEAFPDAELPNETQRLFMESFNIV